MNSATIYTEVIKCHFGSRSYSLYFNSCETDEYASGDCDDQSFQSAKSCNLRTTVEVEENVTNFNVADSFQTDDIYSDVSKIESMKLCKFYLAQLHICYLICGQC